MLALSDKVASSQNHEDREDHNQRKREHCEAYTPPPF